MAAWLPSLALAAHLVPARQLEAREKRPRLPSGVTALDALLGGGWPRGGLCELTGGRGAGRTALMLASVGQALRRLEAVALVDVGGTLDLAAARRAGVPLGRLLWIRCHADKALGAAEIALGAGGLGLLAVDLGDDRPRAPTAAWLRLKRAAEQHGTAVLVAAIRRPQGALGTCAVTLSQARPRFRGAGAPPLLEGLEARADIARGGEATEGTATVSITHNPG